ncbi:DNA mismatch repair protein MutS [Sorangium cellulosum]|uniref:Endonuclease MutS2 n=1 Tax=Sorangium cellulosum TaxID=56 RepID=A0A4P2Q8U9_SORCE|nr:Smr/MutS family protein [Sorangium cellulosum]AUX25929.1 DNA mismatch repair protein MutS [Sorangium cellulosum]
MEHDPEGPLADPCPPKTRADLEWDRVLEALAERCASRAGKRLARALPFAATRAEALTALAEVREAVQLDAAGEPLPTRDVAEIEAALDRARIGAALANEELRAVLGLLEAARTLRQYLQGRRHAAPSLYAACAVDPELDAVARDLAFAFDPDGTLSDRASPQLESLRAERRAVRERLVRRLEDLIQKHEDILQDRYWTERDGRYVLPVRSDAHERFPGIVHATSASGATVFVEPRALVEAGNRMKMVDAEVAREEQAIYAALTARVAGDIESVAAAARALAHADVRAASARLAKDLDLAFPEVPGDAFDGGRGAPEGAARRTSLELIGGRHPLLALDGVEVVPSDVAVSAGRAMIVSGPNAGGKTVALKALGLAALMARAGLPVAAREGSRVALFDVVLTDVGDDQNLHKNLSTFSAHVKNLGRILGETRPGALVLLDELAGGTDPREGEALAAAVLDSLCARGGTVACTTHYEGLKALALGDPRFENASVGFDLGTMSPTFRLVVGVPGASSALAVARQFGIPGTVLERAERFLTKEAVTFEQMVEKLSAERRALELARADAEREAAASRSKRRELEGEIARLREKERAVITREGEALLASLKRAREDLRAAQARLRGKPTEEDVRAAARAMDAVGQKMSLGGELELGRKAEPPARPAVDPAAIRVGARVYVPRLRAEAEVVEVLSGGQLRVAAGALKLTTSIAELRGAGAPPGAAPPQPQRRVELDAAADPDVPIQTAENTVDLRGLRAHEAVAMAEQFLDRSLGAGRRVTFFVHGHGTGALRDAVREALRASPYVARVRPGGPGEGGDGVTVAWLKW